MERMGQNHRRRVRFVQFASSRHRLRNLSSTTASCLLLHFVVAVGSRRVIKVFIDIIFFSNCNLNVQCSCMLWTIRVLYLSVADSYGDGAC